MTHASETGDARWLLVRTLVERALAAPSHMRDALLVAQSAGDDALLDAARRLLRDAEAVASGTGVLDRGARALLASSDADTLHGMRADAGADAVRTRLAPALADRYRIDRLLGAGGMAFVFAAHDLRHARPVAIKVLRPALGELLGARRFLTEIRVTASLHHPGIVPLFDSGEVDGVPFYVMPMVDGESLRERVRREGTLPIADALAITRAVATALDYGHRRGIVHRDLKPENILLQDGAALVADYGVALALSAAAEPRLTGASLVVGTMAYMSPEQAAGTRVLDGRSDQYALACVLHELLVGTPPPLASPTSTVAPLRTMRADVPVAVESALSRALSVRPDARWPTMRAFADALTNTGAYRWRPRPALVVTGAAVVGAGILAAMAAMRDERAADRAAPVARFVMQFAPRAYTGRGAAPAVLPDGSAIVYVGVDSAGTVPLVRPIDELRARTIGGLTDAVSAVPSPDGRALAVLTATDRLMRVPLDGGTPTELAHVFRFARVAWPADDTLLVDAWALSTLAWVPATGGEPRALTRLDLAAGESRHSSPRATPDGRHVVFVVERDRQGPAPVYGQLASAPLAGRAAGTVTHRTSAVTVRQLVAVRDGVVLAIAEDGLGLVSVPIDADGTIGGPAETVLRDERTIESASLADDGTLVYTRSTSSTVPVRTDADGTTRAVGALPPGTYMNPRLSPDGRELLVMAVSSRGSDLWILDMATGTRRQLTNTGTALVGSWTTDGRSVLYADQRAGGALLRVRADGVARVDTIIDATGLFTSAATAGDSSVIVQRLVARRWELWIAPLVPHATARPLLRDAGDVLMPAVSPDGRWLAYATTTAGRPEVHVRPLAGGAPVQVSLAGGTEPVWRPDGSAIIYRDGRRLIAAVLARDGALAFTRRDTLGADRYEGGMPHQNIAILPRGAGFVAMQELDASARETVVVTRWFGSIGKGTARR